MDEQKKLYVAEMVLWHSKELRYIQPGEPVDLSHLPPEDVDHLLATGRARVHPEQPEQPISQPEQSEQPEPGNEHFE